MKNKMILYLFFISILNMDVLTCSEFEYYTKDFVYDLKIPIYYKLGESKKSSDLVKLEELKNSCSYFKVGYYYLKICNNYYKSEYYFKKCIELNSSWGYLGMYFVTNEKEYLDKAIGLNNPIALNLLINEYSGTSEKFLEYRIKLYSLLHEEIISKDQYNNFLKQENKKLKPSYIEFLEKEVYKLKNVLSSLKLEPSVIPDYREHFENNIEKKE